MEKMTQEEMEEHCEARDSCWHADIRRRIEEDPFQSVQLYRNVCAWSDQHSRIVMKRQFYKSDTDKTWNDYTQHPYNAEGVKQILGLIFKENPRPAYMIKDFEDEIRYAFGMKRDGK